MEPLLTINQVSKRSGVAASALRYYEAQGLITAHRAESGHRRFQRSTLRRVAFIVFAQRLGMSLDEIHAELLKLPTNHVPTGRDWARLSSAWTARIDARIAELERLRRGLTQCIGCGCLSLKICTMLNPGDSVADEGPGPRFWVGPGGGRRRRRHRGAVDG
jgi:MerR family transcriptional regulator, redox-sensitive transcriptional activator SoxR